MNPWTWTITFLQYSQALLRGAKPVQFSAPQTSITLRHKCKTLENSIEAGVSGAMARRGSFVPFKAQPKSRNNFLFR